MTATQPGQAFVHSGIPPRVRALIWEVFFRSRGRGVSFEDHLPWASDADTLCVAIDPGEADMADAALLIRSSPLAGTGMIGFVAVREAVRGRGLSRILLDGAIVAAAGTYRSLLLWTDKAAVYEAAGFVVCGRDVALRFQLPPNPEPIGFDAGPWPPCGTSVGLPAFAIKGGTATCAGASLVYALSGETATVMGWTGTPEVVTRLIASVWPGIWHMNVGDDDPLERAVARVATSFLRAPGALTMRRDLDPKAAGALARITPLERI